MTGSEPRPELEWSIDVIRSQPDATTIPDAQASDDGWLVGEDLTGRQLARLKSDIEDLAEAVPVVDRTTRYADLVGSAHLKVAPIHRWYYYKESFSPELPSTVLDDLELRSANLVVDPFAGVGTTALGLRDDPRVATVVGIEYSPFAHFVGYAKLASHGLRGTTLRRLSEPIVNPRGRRQSGIPALSSFARSDIFDRLDLEYLLRVRDALNAAKLSDRQRRFFRLGLAGIIEDVSGTMKDGRALRIKRGRARRPNAIVPTEWTLRSNDPRELLRGQLLAMTEDIDNLTNSQRKDAKRLTHLAGDALQPCRAVAPGTADLVLYSPPYLNCVDYTEVYKLELWLLGFVSTHEEFRRLREGTLRSHPSIQFGRSRPFPDDPDDVFRVVDSLAAFLEGHLTRASVGSIVRNYFEDMYVALKEQYTTLRPGGRLVCVLANSTFTRRERTTEGWSDLWRMPVLSDVIIARLAKAAGFEGPEIWMARRLRPRNATSGSARESLVVARKPD